MNETGLYDFRVTQEIGMKNRKWDTMGWRKRELLLLHICLCIMMCNKELVSKKSKRKNIEGSPAEASPGPSREYKRPRLEKRHDVQKNHRFQSLPYHLLQHTHTNLKLQLKMK